MALATQKAIKRVIERVRKEKISWYRAAKEEGVSLATIYNYRRSLISSGRLEEVLRDGGIECPSCKGSGIMGEP